MFCRNCGAQLEEGSIFCPMCGANNANAASEENAQVSNETDKAVEDGAVKEDGAQAQSAPERNAQAQSTPEQNAQAQSTQEQPVPETTWTGNAAAAGASEQSADAAAKGKNLLKSLGTKKLGIIAAAIVAAIVLLIVFSSGSSSDVLKVDKNAVTYVGNGYFMDADGNSKEVDELYSTYTSMDRSVMLYTDYSDDLYLIDSDLKTERIASDVTSVYVGRDGKYVVYLSNEDSDYYNQVLYIYDVSKNKSKEIDSDVYGDYLTISVSGQTVAYVKDYESGDFDTYIAGYSTSAKKIDSKGRRAVAVSDNGKKAYLVGDGDLYYYNGKDAEKVEKDVSSSFWTNSDLSELVFTKNGSTYFCKPGKDAEKIDGSSIYYVVYPETYGSASLGNSTQALANDTIKGQVVYNSEGKLLWVNKKADDMVKIDSNVYDVKMSSDGSSIVYVSGSKVYKVTKFKESMESKLIYEDEDVYSLAVSDDLRKIYGFSYDDDTIYYLKGNNKAEKISEDVDSFAFNDKDGKLYFVTDEELYEAKTSSSSKKKVSVDGDAYSVSAVLSGVVAYSRDGSDYTCYLISKKQVKVYEED